MTTHPPVAVARIAAYLPIEARQAACSAQYDGSPRRDEEGRCPIGRALDEMDVDAPPAPDSRSVAVCLWDGDRETKRLAIVAAASLFILPWDRGEISDADLCRVLGVDDD